MDRCLKLVQASYGNDKETTQSSQQNLRCFEWVQQSILSLANRLQAVIKQHLELTIFEDLESAKKGVVFDVVLLDPPIHRSAMLPDVLRILPSLRTSERSVIVIYSSIFSSAKEADLLGVVQDGCIYKDEPPRDRSLSSSRDVKPWLYELFISIVKPSMVRNNDR